MGEIIKDGKFSGERALYDSHNLILENATFFDGESPIKECSDITIKNSSFLWKYPIWYSKNISCDNVFFDIEARSGIWYVDNISIKNSIMNCPKCFRRCNHVYLENVKMTEDGREMIWYCNDIHIKNLEVNGNYFGMNIDGADIDNLTLNGKYAFDGAKNVHLTNSHLVTKDTFWNSMNITVENSTIIGEYIGWNSENLTFINCHFKSLQGFCYIKNLKFVNCTFEETSLCFELCENIDADIRSHIDSVKNPLSGIIRADSIGELILEEKYVDKSKIKIITRK